MAVTTSPGVQNHINHTDVWSPMTARIYDLSSTVESFELSKTGRAFLYPPTEKIRVIEVDNFPLLGKLTAFRFIEWVLKNPEGVISLPTGKTPEHFIKWVRRILERWDQPGDPEAVRGVWDRHSRDARTWTGCRSCRSMSSIRWMRRSRTVSTGMSMSCT